MAAIQELNSIINKNDLEGFKKFIVNAYRLNFLLISIWPLDLKDKLLQFVIKNSSLLMFLYTNDIGNDDKTSKSIRFLSGLLTQYKNPILKALLDDSEIFKKITPNANVLSNLGFYFPQHKKLLIDKVINDEKNFLRIFKDKDDFDTFEITFGMLLTPEEREVFNQKTIHPLKVFKQLKLLRVCNPEACVGVFSHRHPLDAFPSLPPELSQYIGSFLNIMSGKNLSLTCKNSNHLYNAASYQDTAKRRQLN